MDHPVVVGVDGSDTSLLAVDWAVEEAARHGRALRVVHAFWWERYEGFTPLTSHARPAARTVAEKTVASAERRAAARRPEVRVSGEVITRDPVDALVREGESAFALVVGSRGLGTLIGMLLGSVGLGVAGRASCPTVVVRGAEPNREGEFHRVLLGVADDSAGAPAVPFALREAELRDCELRAVHAWHRPGDAAHEGTAPEAYAHAARRLVAEVLYAPVAKYPNVQVHHNTPEGPAHHALVKAAERADLLVVGSHRRHGAPGLHLGVVDHMVLEHAPCPVAVVPGHR